MEADFSAFTGRSVWLGDEGLRCDRRSGCGFEVLDDADDVVHHLLDQSLVVAFGHDANQGLGAGGADDQAAALAEPIACILDNGLDRRCFERNALGEADILENLRDGLELAADFADRLVGALDAGQNLKRADEAVARGGEVRQNDMARLLAADIHAMGAHMLHHVAVAHGPPWCGAIPVRYP